MPERGVVGRTIASGPVRIELSTGVTSGDVERSQVANARDLDVIRGLDEVCTFD